MRCACFKKRGKRILKRDEASGWSRGSWESGFSGPHKLLVLSRALLGFSPYSLCVMLKLRSLAVRSCRKSVKGKGSRGSKWPKVNKQTHVKKKECDDSNESTSRRSGPDRRLPGGKVRKAKRLPLFSLLMSLKGRGDATARGCPHLGGGISISASCWRTHWSMGKTRSEKM